MFGIGAGFDPRGPTGVNGHQKNCNGPENRNAGGAQGMPPSKAVHARWTGRHCGHGIATVPDAFHLVREIG